MYQHQPGGALGIFLSKMFGYLRQAPAVWIFVFDGPGRPSFKRGKDINTHTIPAWVAPCKVIIESFGFYSHQVCLHLNYRF